MKFYNSAMVYGAVLAALLLALQDPAVLAHQLIEPILGADSSKP